MRLLQTYTKNQSIPYYQLSVTFFSIDTMQYTIYIYIGTGSINSTALQPHKNSQPKTAIAMSLHISQPRLARIPRDCGYEE